MEGRFRARCLATKFNRLDPNSEPREKYREKQAAVLHELVGKIGAGCFIEPPFIPDYGCNIIIGNNCFANFKYDCPNFPSATQSPSMIEDRLFLHC